MDSDPGSAPRWIRIGYRAWDLMVDGKTTACIRGKFATNDDGPVYYTVHVAGRPQRTPDAPGMDAAMLLAGQLVAGRR